MQQTIDQKRAAYAWNVVQAKSKSYVNLTKSAGALIMGNGLMATLAFYQGKGGEHHSTLLSHILNWLKSRRIVEKNDYKGVMDELHGMSSQQYMQATQETLDLLRWLRQLSPTVNIEE